MTKRMVVALLLLCGAPAHAVAAEPDMAALAREAGLSERQYRMLAGPSSSYAEYRTSYGHLRRKLQLAAMREARDADALDAVEAVELPAPRSAEAETYALPDDQ